MSETVSREKAESSAGKPTWVKMKVADLEKLVVDLAKKGHSPAQIGLILRDQHGVPKANLLGKKITQILKEHHISYKDGQAIIDGKIATLQKHGEMHRHDHCAKRALTKRLWDLYRLKKQSA